MAEPVELHEADPVHIPETRGWYVVRLIEIDGGILAEALVYDGPPEPLKTPEASDTAATTATVIEWAETYAWVYLADPVKRA